MERLNTCRTRRVGSIATCRQLQPAGTGSTTLGTLLSIANSTPSSRSCTAHTVGAVNGVGCFLLTLRDPVERLESGCKYEEGLPSRHHIHNAGGSILRPQLGVYSLEAAISALNDSKHQAHAYYRELQRVGASITLSKQCPSPHLPPHSLNNFFIPQVAYFEEPDCGASELHVFCTESLTEDWNAFLPARWGLQLNTSAVAEREYASRKAAGHLVVSRFHANSSDIFRRTSFAKFARRCTLTHTAAEYVRTKLFRDDTLLHRALCSPRDPSYVQGQRP
jgi:hypothetical protein